MLFHSVILLTNDEIIFVTNVMLLIFNLFYPFVFTLDFFNTKYELTHKMCIGSQNVSFKSIQCSEMS